MIQNLPQSALKLLLSYYNHLWHQSVFPKAWLHSIIIPIHKPGKPRSSLSSYRPISLTNHLCKIFERMVNFRLSWTLESNSLLSTHQFGFRKFRSSMDHLASLDTEIRSALQRRHHLGLVSLDLKSAFDTINPASILIQLMDMGFSGPLPKFLTNFLSPRTIQVKANGLKSDPISVHFGVPQGSVLSPTLFNIAMTSLTKTLSHSTNLKLFADDIIIFSSSISSSDITRTLQYSLNTLNSWASTNGLSFSPSKSRFLHICKSRTCPRINPLLINNSPIPSTDSLNILGLTFDSKMSWLPHIKSLKLRTTQDLNLLKILANTKWGSDQPTLIHLYKALTLSKISYADFIYGAAHPSTLKSLNTIQNQALRSSTGAFRTSPITSLQCVSSLPPLYLIRQKSLLKYYASILNRTHMTPILNLSNITRRSYLFPPNSIPDRIRKLLDLHNLASPVLVYPSFPSFPPWKSPPPKVDLFISSSHHNKHNSTKEELNALITQRISTIYIGYIKIYTDGSKSSQGTGAAIYSSSYTKLLKLPLHASIFTAEMLAIMEATKLAVSASPGKKFLILSDSLSALKSLSSLNYNYAYIRQISDLLYLANTKKIIIKYLWIPGHIGNRGNERADSLAKSAALMTNLPVCPENHPKDYISLLHNLFSQAHQLDWDFEDPGNKLWQNKPLVFPPLHHPELSRTENTLLRRLAIGHTYHTHIHLLKKEDPPICNICQLPITVKHIFEASHYSQLRAKFNLPSNLQNIIISFPKIHKQITGYLKEIGFRA